MELLDHRNILGYGFGVGVGVSGTNNITSTVPGRIDSTRTFETSTFTSGVHWCVPGSRPVTSTLTVTSCGVSASSTGNGPEIITSMVWGDACAANPSGRPMILICWL